MAQFSRTWWGTRFITALEQFTDPGRLSRGQSYSRSGRILSHEIRDGVIRATVRGSINPYFGVYKEPRYATTIAVTPISAKNWSTVIAHIASRAGLVAKLLLNEMPDNIEDVFESLNLHLLPHSADDFDTSCSCPDYARPCKHIAGVYYLVASELDRDPFLMFELRGLNRQELKRELAQSPLGQILSSSLDDGEAAIEPSESYFTRPIPREAEEGTTLRAFWSGPKRMPSQLDARPQPGVPALLIKKQGDYPPFWPKDSSFVEAMEELYERVRAKN